MWLNSKQTYRVLIWSIEVKVFNRREIYFPLEKKSMLYSLFSILSTILIMKRKWLKIWFVANVCIEIPGVCYSALYEYKQPQLTYSIPVQL